jgi:hypothetical protein
MSSRDERERVEAEYFEDDDAFEEMLTAEDDLIDAYARGELVGEERRGFEKCFLTSVTGRDRVQFARAFDDVLAHEPLEAASPSTSLVGFGGVFRIAAIAGVIVVIAVLSWLVIDRRRMSSELRELRAESAELRKRTDELQRTAPPEPMRQSNVTDQAKQQRDRKTSNFPSRKVTNSRQKIARRKPEHEKKPREQPFTNTQDASIGNNSFRPQTTQLPLSARNLENLLTLTPTSTDYSLHRLTTNKNATTITVPSSLNWFILQLDLETVAQHIEYRATIQTTDGRPIISVDWIEALTPNQISMDTPVIRTDDLLSGHYRLLLLGKEPDGSFVKVAEYSFQIVR